jgi:hypothetical protein
LRLEVAAKDLIEVGLEGNPFDEQLIYLD